jgi:hypothetical protein
MKIYQIDRDEMKGKLTQLPRIQFVGKHYVVNNTGNVGNENK